MAERGAEGRFFKIEACKDQRTVGDRPMHYHDNFELYFMDAGSCKYFIDNKVYSVCEGDLILIPEGTLHKTSYDGTNARILINCSRHYLPLDALERLPPLLHLYRNPALVPRLRELMQQMQAEQLRADAFSEQILTGWMSLLFYTLLREAHTCEDVCAERSYISDAVAFIKAHYAAEVTLARTAAAVSVSPAHLSRLFKRETGLGFSEYLGTYRLQRAEAMLKSDPSLRICDVAYACGFNDSNYFCEKFKALYGFPPSKLKR
jgi:AraC-like DNA-binding protein